MPRLSRRQFAAGLGASLTTALASPLRAGDAVPLVLEAAPTSGDDATGRASGRANAFNGSIPGPTIRVRRGQEVFVRVINRLDRPFSIHWHGVRIANAMDGAAGLTQPPIRQGESFDYRFPCPDAGTYWYHPDASSEGLPLGLHGLLVVEDDGAAPADRDIGLLVDCFETEGGTPLVSVNGKPFEEVALAENERILLRLVNAARDRVASLAFGGLDPTILALDGTPTNEAFVPAGHRLDLAPGGRADVAIDGTLVKDARAGIAILNGDAIVEIVRISRADGPALRPQPLPQPMAGTTGDLPADIDLSAARRTELALASSRPFDASGGPLFTVKRGTPVTLALMNGTDSGMRRTSPWPCRAACSTRSTMAGSPSGWTRC